MSDIEEEDYFESSEEPLSEDVDLKQVVHKLNEIGQRVESIEFALFNEEVGVKGGTAALELKAKTAHGKQLFISKEYRAVKQDLTVVKGIIQRQAVQIDTLDNKTTDLTARSMAKNMIISGIIENKDENCKYQAKSFLKDEMDLNLDLCPEYQIKTAQNIKSKLLIGLEDVVKTQKGKLLARWW